jgi:hypothetical protein
MVWRRFAVRLSLGRRCISLALGLRPNRATRKGLTNVVSPPRFLSRIEPVSTAYPTGRAANGVD